MDALFCVHQADAHGSQLIPDPVRFSPVFLLAGLLAAEHQGVDLRITLAKDRVGLARGSLGLGGADLFRRREQFQASTVSKLSMRDSLVASLVLLLSTS